MEITQELTNLRKEFHRCLNNAEWDNLSNLFTDEAHLDYGQYGQAHGAKEIRHYYSALAQKIAEFRRGATEIALKNFIHGHQSTILSDESATGVCFFEEMIRFNKETEIYQSIGQFTDKYVYQDDRWLFAKVQLDHYWVVPDNEGWRWPW
nr:nuclear transport factor 2 family protein [Actinopolyspora biskrensis]